MFYNRTQNRHKRWYHIFLLGHKKLCILACACAFILVACLTGLIIYTMRAASYNIDILRNGMQGSVLYDSGNRMVAVLSEREEAPVQYAELPECLIQAFLAREDAHFFEHGGVVYSAMFRSLIRNILFMRYKEGASTITMQLTRNVFELQGKTLDRKLLEMMLAQRIERNYDKPTILCQYLSRIYFGQNCYGVREAARFYFNKNVCDLNLAEAATLAGSVCGPSLFNAKTSPEDAKRVRGETLRRMLSLGMITQEQLDEAQATPLPDLTNAAPNTAAHDPCYPALWANAELNNMPDEVQGELGKGVSASGYMSLPIQQFTENATHQALAAIEAPGFFPPSWLESSAPPTEGKVNAFITARRPVWLKRPSDTLAPGQGILQCCVLVLDSRVNHRGNMLAVMGGRDARDGVDRWQSTLVPGRAVAPLVFCCACLPGGSAHHIVANSASITGSRLGYDVVRAFFDTLALDTTLPDRAHEQDLYEGRFTIKKLDLARILFDLQNQGRGYRPTLISSVWSHAQRLLYTADSGAVPEYIRRESAVAVSHLPPFRYHEGEPIVLHEELPENGGYWAMVFNDKGVCVFVWLGVEGAEGAPPPTSKELNSLLSLASISLARELHTQARKELRSPTSSPTP